MPSTITWSGDAAAVAQVDTCTVGGTLIDKSSGTFTTVTVLAKGVYDHSKSLTAKTITTLTLNSSATYSDPYGVLTLTNGILLSGCQPKDVTLNIPPGKNLSIA